MVGLIFVCVCFTTKAQYLHLSNVVGGKTSFNHAMNNADPQVNEWGLVYRDQGIRNANTGFQRLHFTGALSLTDRVGMHIQFNQLKAGHGPLAFSNIQWGIPCHLWRNKSVISSLSIAPIVAFSRISKGGMANYTFEESFLGSGNTEVLDYNNQQAWQWGASVATTIALNKFKFSLGYEYLTKASNAGYLLLHSLHKTLSSCQLPLYGNHTILDLTYLHQKAGGERQHYYQSAVTTKWNGPVLNAFQLGLGIRQGDGLTFLLGTKLKQKYALYAAYDYTTSGLSLANGNNGAIELGIRLSFIKKENKKLPSLLFEPLPLIAERQLHRIEPLKTNLADLPILTTRMEEVFDSTEMDKPRDEIKIDKVNMFLFYHDVNMVPIKSTSKSTLNGLIGFLEQHHRQVDKVEIISYTDSRGSNDYNMGISERRANALKSIIKLYGISEISISWKGVGETQLTNDCYDGMDCLETEHNANRRTAVHVYWK